MSQLGRVDAAKRRLDRQVARQLFERADACADRVGACIENPDYCRSIEFCAGA